jgi:hypothetical protein
MIHRLSQMKLMVRLVLLPSKSKFCCNALEILIFLFFFVALCSEEDDDESDDDESSREVSVAPTTAAQSRSDTPLGVNVAAAPKSITSAPMAIPNRINAPSQSPVPAMFKPSPPSLQQLPILSNSVPTNISPRVNLLPISGLINSVPGRPGLPQGLSQGLPQGSPFIPNLLQPNLATGLPVGAQPASVTFPTSIPSVNPVGNLAAALLRPNTASVPTAPVPPSAATVAALLNERPQFAPVLVHLLQTMQSGDGNAAAASTFLNALLSQSQSASTPSQSMSQPPPSNAMPLSTAAAAAAAIASVNANSFRPVPQSFTQPGGSPPSRPMAAPTSAFLNALHAGQKRPANAMSPALAEDPNKRARDGSAFTSKAEPQTSPPAPSR